MAMRIAVLFATLLVASPVAADTLVTWEATGELTGVFQGRGFPTPLPPVGTPISVTVTFAPDQAFPHFTGTPGCMGVNVTGTVTIGGHTWTGGGRGWTHAQLPGDSCGGSNTQFSLHSMTPPPDHPWASDEPFALGPPQIFILSYRDLLVQDAFPDAPTPASSHPFFNAHLFTFDEFSAWNIAAGLHLEALNQAAPVPEPGTMALLGLGLAAAARARKRK